VLVQENGANRARTPANRLADTLRARVLVLVRTTYAGCNDVHLVELLAERDAITVTRATLQRWRRQARARLPGGWLLQADGSLHRWLGPDLPELTLTAGIDDVTGTIPWARFRAQEDAAGYVAWLRRVVKTKGVPVSRYVDRHGFFPRRTNVPLAARGRLCRWTVAGPDGAGA